MLAILWILSWTITGSDERLVRKGLADFTADFCLFNYKKVDKRALILDYPLCIFVRRGLNSSIYLDRITFGPLDKLIAPPWHFCTISVNF